MVRDLRDDLDDPHSAARGVFDRRLTLHSGREIPALPLPLQREFVAQDAGTYPALGESDGEVASIWRDD